MILMRHGQTVFNVVFGESRVDPGVPDPCLTADGRAQALAAAQALAGEDVRRVIASPYRRALETAEIVAAALDVPVCVEPLVRERAAFSCDVGSPRSALVSRWPGWRFPGPPQMDETWWQSGDEPEESLHARCRAFCAAMSGEADWAHVAVVTHWGVIRALTGRRVRNCETVRIDPSTAVAPHPDRG